MCSSVQILNLANNNYKMPEENDDEDYTISKHDFRVDHLNKDLFFSSLNPNSGYCTDLSYLH